MKTSLINSPWWISVQPDEPQWLAELSERPLCDLSKKTQGKHFDFTSNFSFCFNRESWCRIFKHSMRKTFKKDKTDLCQMQPHWLWGCGWGLWGPGGRLSGPLGGTRPSWTQTCRATGRLHRPLSQIWRQSLDRKPTCRPIGERSGLNIKRAVCLRESGGGRKGLTDLAVLVRVFLHPHPGQVDVRQSDWQLEAFCTHDLSLHYTHYCLKVCSLWDHTQRERERKETVRSYRKNTFYRSRCLTHLNIFISFMFYFQINNQEINQTETNIKACRLVEWDRRNIWHPCKKLYRHVTLILTWWVMHCTLLIS